MSKVFQRIENGATETVSQRDGMDEINNAMMGGRRNVKEMSQISRTDYVIGYKNGSTVMLKLVDEPVNEQPKAAPVVERGPKAWTGEETVIVTVKGKRYVAGLELRGQGDHRFYWSERDGKTFGATRDAYAQSKPGSVAHAIWTAVSGL